MANIKRKKKDSRKFGKDTEKLEPLHAIVGKCKMFQPLQKTVWSFLRKLELLYDLVIQLQSIFPEKIESEILNKSYAHLWSLQHYSQLVRCGSNLNVHWWINR